MAAELTIQQSAPTDSKKQSLIKTSKRGYPFDVYDNKWQLEGSVYVKFNNTVNRLKPTILEHLRLNLSNYAEFKSGSYCVNILTSIALFLKDQNTDEFSAIDLTNWRVKLTPDIEYKLGVIKTFLLDAYDNGYKLINADGVKVLEAMVLKGNPIGVAVAKGCPHSGAFDHLEQQAIIFWANQAFQEKIITLEQFSFLIALQFTGRRPVQIASLAFGDLISVKRPDGTSQFKLRVPRAKQRGADFRESFKTIPINEDLYFLLYNQAHYSLNTVEKIIGKKLSPETSKKIPIYIDKKKVEKLSNYDDLITKLDGPADYLYSSNYKVEVLNKLTRLCEAKSARLNGDTIHINARRFRYTYATNLRNKGAGAHVLAEALDHSTIQYVLVYTQMTPDFVKSLNDSMATVMAPLAQAFQGKLVDDKRESYRRMDSRSLIKSANAEDVGNCGTQAYCSSGFLSCYTCRDFEPWLNAPHDQVLNCLINKRKQQKEWGVSELVISATDQTYLAVKNVVDMCTKIKSEQSIVIDSK